MKSLEILCKQSTRTSQLFAQCALPSSYEGKVLEAVIQNRNVGYLLWSFDIFGMSCRVYFACEGAACAQNEGNQRHTTIINVKDVTVMDYNV